MRGSHSSVVEHSKLSVPSFNKHRHLGAGSIKIFLRKRIKNCRYIGKYFSVHSMLEMKNHRQVKRQLIREKVTFSIRYKTALQRNISEFLGSVWNPRQVPHPCKHKSYEVFSECKM